MNRFLLGALAMGAVFVLTSFAVAIRAPSRPIPGGPAWTVSQYQMDRAFRIQVPPSGATGQIPTGGGFIITQVRSSVPNGSNANCSITVNGATEDFSFHFGGQEAIELNPPIICRPNDVVTISNASGVWIAGYTTYPGET